MIQDTLAFVYRETATGAVVAPTSGIVGGGGGGSGGGSGDDSSDVYQRFLWYYNRASALSLVGAHSSHAVFSMRGCTFASKVTPQYQLFALFTDRVGASPDAAYVAPPPLSQSAATLPVGDGGVFGRWCKCFCDVHLCFILSFFFLSSASALVTSICVLCAYASLD
jgi:hypothetical protein